MLIETNKVQAPSLLLEDYNYFINKGINQYINKTYNTYEVNQERSDGLRVLKSTIGLEPTKKSVNGSYSNSPYANSKLFGNIWEVDLPDDYVHILNCIVEYDIKNDYKCYDKGGTWSQGANRLTSDAYSGIINNHYMRPSYKMPYYYINNVTTKPTAFTKDDQEEIDYGTVEYDGSGYSKNVERVGGERYGNKNKVKLELRYGPDNKTFEPKYIFIDYIKAPQHVRLTHDHIDEVYDTSPIMEFPDYVCQEIIKEVVMLIMENASDPRLQTNIPINQSIADPGAQQQQSR